MCKNQNMQYIAGIVTYNPEVARLKKNIEAISKQVTEVIIIDNASTNYYQISNIMNNFNNVKMYTNVRNEGIASALNKIIRIAKEKKYEWVLLLDQDSIVDCSMINTYNEYLDLPKCAVLCPKIFDNNLKQSNNDNTGVERVGICITSGSLVNVNICNSLGGFDEKLFIDSVDNEYCLRLYFEGYNIYRINSTQLNHELGLMKKHFFKKTSNHNSFRRYHISRNSTYVALKYHNILYKTGMSRNEINQIYPFLDYLLCPTRVFLRIIQFILLIVLYEDNKKEKITALIRGMVDGRKMYKIERNEV
ncbi:rhamnosyltransferase [Kandleria vitulina]|uniref:glycosyltransferase family 2 protein n=1 Tax=Kandleria vitulina TaxID=1630 RepID=UPI000888AD22|nr:glycosyltransferase family 2 protein [Kandleria vitulina]SDL41601.1 rhamnosyltransferase [Kandleria vitulina]